MAQLSLPCPGFEGFEKRLDIEFERFDTLVCKNGLRAIPRNELDMLLDAAQCTIVSQLRNNHFDSYVLSESSLFVYPSRIVIKTCGTTRLLECIPLLLKSARKILMRPRRCRYTRGSFLFPEAQPALHQSFSDESKLLDKHFGHLGNGGKAYVLGDSLNFPNWHIYVADSQTSKPTAPKTTSYTLEMCMTKLDQEKALQFFQSSNSGGVKQLTKSSGISDLLPGSEIDDFLFEPCGYSMNGIEGNAHSTIHITPEDGFSYASFEAMGYSDSDIKLSELVEKVLTTFKPGCVSIALHVDGEVDSRGTWGASLPKISGYFCDGTSRQVLPLESCVAFHTYKRRGSQTVAHSVEPLPLVEQLSIKPATKSLKKFQIDTPDFGENFLSSLCDFDKNVASTVSALNPTAIGCDVKDLDTFIDKYIADTGIEDPFYVMDIAPVLDLWKTWTSLMPRVRPFYAVKCNPDPALLSLLASLGSGFDVASQAEMEIASTLDIKPSDVIFANPCKLPSHIAHASSKNFKLTTFDSETELYKLKKYFPDAQAVLRLRADDRGARCPLGVKYGAEYEDCEDLLICAKDLGINVVGIAFHVGSGASDPGSYADGIFSARTLFDVAERLGMPKMWFLDIGGGFTSKGGNGVPFSVAASVINSSLDRFFPGSMDVTIIGEPGRFFAEAPFTLATHIFGSRIKRRASVAKPEYWINDGLYGSMNCLLYDHAELSVRPLKRVGNETHKIFADSPSDGLYQSTVFGPTCDGLDTVLRDVWLPNLDCGDWLIFPRMGAYTQAAGSSFNGFDTRRISTVYVFSSNQKFYAQTESDGSDGYGSDSGCERQDFDYSHGSNDFSGEGGGMSSSDDDSF